MESILVTGGAGYVGSHVCKALAHRGYQPIVFDNLERGHCGSVKWGPLEAGDIADAARVRSVLRRHRPAVILHLAGYGNVGESMREPARYYENNVANGQRFLEAVHTAGQTRRIIFSSSCSVYGVVSPRPITEDTPPLPISPYGWSKLLFERMLADYGRACGFQSVSLRYYNAAGADPGGELGEEHDPELHILPLILSAARGAATNVTLHGDDYDTPDGFCVRDFVHVSDIAEAHVLALEQLLRGTVNHPAFNLGSGCGVSLKQLTETVRKVTGRAPAISIGPRRAGDPPYAVADCTLAERELGWQRRFSDLETIIETAWQWLCRQASHPGLNPHAIARPSVEPVAIAGHHS